MQEEVEGILEGAIEFDGVFAICVGEELPLSFERQCFSMKRSASFRMRCSLAFSACLIAYTLPSLRDVPLKMVEKLPVPMCSSLSNSPIPYMLSSLVV